ncbi:C6 zinc finger domain-containing protein [Macroventuria anomochaeta]|uniref:C6 zinc finger domain-containing protein n=1 Tax=Macroventuria anomochaeta TaxID=301207 RepID=A0ACB6RTH7_9PLEO|nr:C6 zinc finger domain-containing protein [Macroventuria anomochaeta]KAF2624434.1 C6 zinc finger domain-containing protein [Macroventuria anomochaeta]
MSTKSAEPESRDNSPDHYDTTEKRISKKRKVLSCYACRSRKMKCDRVYPVCSRCQKTGRADQCSYDPRLLEEAQVQIGQPLTGDANNTMFTMHDNGVNEDFAKEGSSDALCWKVRMQERRIEMLEKKLAATSSSNNPSQLKDLPIKEPEMVEEMMFRGKGFKTQFHGTTSVMSMISQYRDLQAFTRETLAVDNSMLRIKKDFKGFRDRRKILMKEKIARTYGTDDEIFALLPPKHEVDIQAALYFRTWETTYRILHEPTFWQEYNSFWARRPSDDKQAGFAAMLILIVATTKCSTVKDDVFVGDSTSDRDAASNLIETCELWLNRQPRKRLTLPFFQLQCLALLAKRVNCVKLKQDWITAGDVVRLALASGMHRDPSLLATGRISEYEKEMKKRLWYTITELEIQSSIDSGLQSSLTGLYFDTPAPSNLPDEAFSLETKEMPASRPGEYFTATSYLNAALRSLPLRIHLTKLLNDPSSDMQYSDVLHYDEQITSVLADFPSWTDSRATIPYALLGLQLRQYLLVLHKPYAKKAFTEKRFAYSFTTSVEAASSIIAIHDDLASQGILILNHFRNDIIRVGMTLSQIAALNCARHGVKPTALPPMRDHTHFADPNIHIADTNAPPVTNKGVPFANKGGFAPPSCQLYLPVLPREMLPRALIKTSIEILERTLHLFERKVMRLGTGYMEYWLLSAAIGMLPAINPPPRPHVSSIAQIRTSTDDMHERCKTALDRFTSLAFRVLAMQQDPKNSLAVGLRESMSGSSPSDVRTPSGASAASPMRGTILSSRAAGSFGSKGVGAFASHSMIGDVPFPVADGGTGGKGEDMMAAFDPLEDMGVDLSGWTFPDFWTFDLAGDF